MLVPGQARGDSGEPVKSYTGRLREFKRPHSGRHRTVSVLREMQTELCCRRISHPPKGLKRIRQML